MSSIRKARRAKSVSAPKADVWLRQCKGPAGRIIQKSQSLRNLQEILAKFLPEPLISHVQVMSLHNNRLALAADGAVWATQLRHQRRNILMLMSQATGTALQQLDIKVSPLYAPPLVRKIRRRLSHQTRHNLSLTANTINDEQLSSALRRLAELPDTTDQ